MNAILARLRRGYARMWRWLTARIAPRKWPAPPQDDTHAYYREQYERMVALLPTLPKGVHHPRKHERRAAVLAFAEILDGLHNYGDDPIPPPGVRRIVQRESRPAPAAPVRFLGSGVASLVPAIPWIIGIGLIASVTGWGSAVWNGWKVDRLENRVERLTEQRDAPCTAAEMRGQTTRASCSALSRAHSALAEAGEITRATAAALEAERAATARARARERRRVRDIQNVLAGSPEPPAWRLRDDEPGEGGTPSP